MFPPCPWKAKTTGDFAPVEVDGGKTSATRSTPSTVHFVGGGSAANPVIASPTPMKATNGRIFMIKEFGLLIRRQVTPKFKCYDQFGFHSGAGRSSCFSFVRRFP